MQHRKTKKKEIWECFIYFSESSSFFPLIYVLNINVFSKKNGKGKTWKTIHWRHHHHRVWKEHYSDFILRSWWCSTSQQERKRDKYFCVLLSFFYCLPWMGRAKAAGDNKGHRKVGECSFFVCCGRVKIKVKRIKYSISKKGKNTKNMLTRSSFVQFKFKVREK